MSTIEYILLFVLLGSVGSLVGGIVLLSNEKFALRVSHFLASFAAGTLLGTAFFDLLPEAQHMVEEAYETGGEEMNIFFWTLIGILSFFLLERFMHWFHHHEEHHQPHEETKTTIPLIIISDTIHNFLDGVVIAATFLVSIPLGIVTTLAVATHEIPQEIGDFGLMLHKGLSRKKILLVNVLSAGAALAGALLTYAIGEGIDAYLPVLLSVTAGFFIYIAASDIIPEIHYEKRRRHALIETGLLLVGVLLIYLVVSQLSHGH